MSAGAGLRPRGPDDGSTGSVRPEEPWSAAVVVSETDLEAWGRRVGASVQPPVFIGLRGSLGAGKSVLARAIARGMGIRGPVPSPTFALAFSYEECAGGEDVELVHMDLYRIEDTAELEGLGWFEATPPGEVRIVEWFERAGDALPPDRWEVDLEPCADPELRSVRVRRIGTPPPIAELH